MANEEAESAQPTLPVEHTTVTQNGEKVDEKQPTGLLDLPDELWSKIGKLVIDDEGIFSEFEITPIYSPYYDTAPRKKLPDITQTCRALRQELLPYYYSTRVEALVDMSAQVMVELSDWIRAVEPGMRQAIRGITACGDGYEVEELKEAIEWEYGPEGSWYELLGPSLNRIGRPGYEFRFL